MQAMQFDADAPVARTAGIATRRERIWGVVGAVVGTAFGVGSALIAVRVEGAKAWTPGLYPEFFSAPRLLAYDALLLSGLAAGLAATGAALVFARIGRYPRTDAFGAGLLGLLLCALSGSLLCFRLLAVIGAL